MEEKDIKVILSIIIGKIKEKQFTWRLEGSANLKLQGVGVAVRDLDITTDENGIAVFREALKGYIVKDFFSEKTKGSSIVCDINGFEIEINSFGDKRLDMFDKIKTLHWKGLELPVLPLEYAKRFYELINRKEKVDIISKHLG